MDASTFYDFVILTWYSIMRPPNYFLLSSLIRVEAPITDHLRDTPSYLEKYKAVQFFPV